MVILGYLEDQGTELESSLLGSLVVHLVATVTYLITYNLLAKSSGQSTKKIRAERWAEEN